MGAPAARPQEKGEPTPARPGARERRLAALCWPYCLRCVCRSRSPAGVSVPHIAPCSVSHRRSPRRLRAGKRAASTGTACCPEYPKNHKYLWINAVIYLDKATQKDV